MPRRIATLRWPVNLRMGLLCRGDFRLGQPDVLAGPAEGGHQQPGTRRVHLGDHVFCLRRLRRDAELVVHGENRAVGPPSSSNWAAQPAQFSRAAAPSFASAPLFRSRGRDRWPSDATLRRRERSATWKVRSAREVASDHC